MRDDGAAQRCPASTDRELVARRPRGYIHAPQQGSRLVGDDAVEAMGAEEDRLERGERVVPASRALDLTVPERSLDGTTAAQPDQVTARRGAVEGAQHVDRVRLSHRRSMPAPLSTRGRSSTPVPPAGQKSDFRPPRTLYAVRWTYFCPAGGTGCGGSVSARLRGRTAAGTEPGRPARRARAPHGPARPAHAGPHVPATRHPPSRHAGSPRPALAR